MALLAITAGKLSTIVSAKTRVVNWWVRNYIHGDLTVILKMVSFELIIKGTSNQEMTTI